MIDAANLVVALVALGMALAFVSADPQSPTSRALASFFACGGVVNLLVAAARSGWIPSEPSTVGRVFVLASGATFLAGFEWLLRVRRTEAYADKGVATGVLLLRSAQGLILLQGVFGLLWPGVRDEVFLQMKIDQGGFFLFAIPISLSLTLAVISVAQTLRANPDHAEKTRLVALVLATPFLVSGLFLAGAWNPIATVVGQMIFLIGAVRYHVAQGERGQFLARFLSPQVARLVRERGLSNATQQHRVQLSVVACDLRGFTAMSQTAAPEDVMQLLQSYYDGIGEVVSECGGTIKDFAGDGILALVGAPIPFADHAPRAIEMALKMRERGALVLNRWRELGIDLGLGIGVASGYVTVGALGGERRLEYAAVGPPVNLAARLCALAEPGQILADQRTVGLARNGAGVHQFVKLEPVTLKGFARPEVPFSVVA